MATIIHTSPVLEDTAAIAYTRQRATLTLANMTIAIHITDPSAPDELVYVFADHASTGSAQVLGSASILADESGDPIPNSAAHYLPFGDWRTEPTAAETSRWYTGHVHDNLSRNDLGLIYMNARFYLPTVARFVSADTIVPDAGNPQSFNRYSYVFNQPLKFTDPNGYCPALPDDWGPAICVAVFIEPPTITAGPFTLHGDGRGFSPHSDPDASRGYMWISPDGSKQEAYMNPSAYLTGPLPFDVVSSGYTWWFEPSEHNTWTVTATDDGYITVAFDLVISGPLEWLGAAPHINGSITFRINADGSIDFAYERDGFPWVEAYYYDGQGGVETLFLSPAVRRNPHDLFAIEPGQGSVSRTVQWFQTSKRGFGFDNPQLSAKDNLCKAGEPC